MKKFSSIKLSKVGVVTTPTFDNLMEEKFFKVLFALLHQLLTNTHTHTLTTHTTLQLGATVEMDQLVNEGNRGSIKDDLFWHITGEERVDVYTEDLTDPLKKDSKFRQKYFRNVDLFLGDPPYGKKFLAGLGHDDVILVVNVTDLMLI